MFLFEPQWVALYMFVNLASLMYEATFAYYIAARGAYNAKESLKKVLAYPTLYAVILGFGVNAAHVELPELFLTYWSYFKGAYVVMGMMILGVALSAMHHFEFSLRYNALVFLGKFMVWPLLMGVFVALDIYVLHLYGSEIHTMLMLLSIMPPAANVTAFATQFNTNPEKAATTVLAGTLFALIAIPLVLVLFGQ
jgi:predicted permease